MKILSKEALREAINTRDLTDPNEGRHAIQLLIEEIQQVLSSAWSSQVHLYRHSPIVSVADNYDRLRYPKDGPARAARYTRYVCEEALLRTSTSALVPQALVELQGSMTGEDLLMCPGVVYRRDSIDRLHIGTPHQIDLWRVSHQALGSHDLHQMIHLVLEKLLPGRAYRVESRIHPYTLEGLQIDVEYQGTWVEVGECGLAHPEILKENLPNLEQVSGLAMGLGLDRICMIRKEVSDIRLLSSSHPKIAVQMEDLLPYKEVSTMPSVKRDMSLVVEEHTTIEELGDRVREVLGEQAEWVEELKVLSESSHAHLSERVIDKLGMKPDQKNVLLRMELKALERTLTDQECNSLRDRVYASLHQGPYFEWAS